MAWIESHQSLGKHHKTIQASVELKMDRHKLIGHLQTLWWWGLDNADIDGFLTVGTTPEMIATGAEIPKRSAEKFVKTMVKVGFIDEITEKKDGKTEKFTIYKLHDWYQYAGKLNAKREANRERMRDSRAKHVRHTNLARAGATVPNQTVPNQEEKEIQEKGVMAGRDDRIEFWKYVAELRAEFTDLDIDAQYEKFSLYWSEGDRKLKRPKLAFRNWLDKARQIQGNGNGNGRQTGKYTGMVKR